MDHPAEETVTLTRSQVESIVGELGAVPGMPGGGIDPKTFWEWLKDAMKKRKPGEKVPRPGHGLPSAHSLQKLLLWAVIIYLVWKHVEK